MEQTNCTTGKRGYKHLTETERYKLEGYWEARLTPEAIAQKLNKHRATVYREIKRGLVVKTSSELIEYRVYRANVAQIDYQRKVVNRERSLKIGNDKALQEYICKYIVDKRYSPDVIIGTIKRKGLIFEGMICVKTLYSYIDRGIFYGVSNKDLWYKAKRKKKAHRPIQRICVRNKMSKSIEDRPAIINDRLEYGHWEGDCVKGKRNKNKTSLFTLTERVSRDEIIVKLNRATQAGIKRAFDRLEVKHGDSFKDKFKSITFDNGMEFSDWESIERSILSVDNKRTQVYFAHSFSSWERGTNENHNRMIRRFIPKGTDISTVPVNKINRIKKWMNNYPRRILGYKTPNEVVLELTDNRKFLS
jgi:IS30 family transposase